ncbi:MAG TPA: lipase maturation factor family protein [Chthoniobacterales bacterium]|jgi:predicted DCC family thiol-disulfide oxidoreductase YuxK|nr:lipase maturation factor family protein [Chthoniobacterales bacterium]
MPNEATLRVANPPPKPLLIWDGECHFCRRWIERWHEITGDEVDYETSQNVTDRFPEIGREQFQRSVVLIEPDGAVFSAAEAVFRSLRCRSSRRWLAWSYYHVPGFAPITEAFYKFVAANRSFASAMTRLLWGDDVRPPQYFWARRWFVRAVGLIFLIAFVSLWVQIDGLFGSNGVTPVAQFLPAARAQLGDRALSILPTLCWLNSSDAFLHFLCGGGVALSILLMAGIAPALSLVVLVIFYLSLAIAGQTFLSFQWDILLLETGFLAIFLAPWRLRWTKANEPPVSRAGMFLLKVLLFKLMVMSGVVKLTSGDDSWWKLTALDYHYWSQPLPTVIAWWADQHAEWFKKFSVAFCLVVEIIVPLFIWAPRRLRLLACGLLVFLQIAIAATGNYCFFNLLTLALCLLLIDDSVVGTSRRDVRGRRSAASLPDRLSIYAAAIVIVVTLPLNARLIYSAFEPEEEWSPVLARIYARAESLRIVNGYGLFRKMTKDRKEIVIEGSADGLEWKPYEFKWKPGDVKRAPGWCQPHQPRLDWQMWFAALGSYRQNPWFVQTVVALLHGNKEVIALFESNPFPQNPPRYIRATFYRYRFTNAEEHRQTGAWWKREELGEYLPSVSIEDVQ